MDLGLSPPATLVRADACQPGCSSLLGLLMENGPFVWRPGFTKPRRNPWSWHELTNVVWIEQPVTVGFSTGQATAKNEDDVARQFLGFWRNFVDAFGMHGWKVYIGAESYGGYYGPYISSHMLDAADTSYYDLGGLIIYDGIMFDGNVQSNIILEAFVEQNHNLMPLDEPHMAYIRNVSETCGFRDYYTSHLTYPPAGPAPLYSPGYKVHPNGTTELDSSCDLTEYVYGAMQTMNPCFNIYNIMDHCPGARNPLIGNSPYFGREDVKKAINAPLNVSWSVCTDRSVFNSTAGDESPPPDKYELPNVIDKTKNVILAQGSFDVLLPLNGVLLGIQNMTWGDELGFRTRPSDPFYVPLYHNGGPRDGPRDDPFAKDVPAGSGVLGTTHQERGLTLVATQLSGHEGPEYAPAASLRHLEKLLGRVPSLSDTGPFTLPLLRNVTQMGTPLGKGTVPIPCLGKGC